MIFNLLPLLIPVLTIKYFLMTVWYWPSDIFVIQSYSIPVLTVILVHYYSNGRDPGILIRYYDYYLWLILLFIVLIVLMGPIIVLFVFTFYWGVLCIKLLTTCCAFDIDWYCTLIVVCEELTSSDDIAVILSIVTFIVLLTYLLLFILI